MPQYRTLSGTLLHPQCQKIKVEGALPRNRQGSVHISCTLNALSDGLKGSLNEVVSVRGWTLPEAVGG